MIYSKEPKNEIIEKNKTISEKIFENNASALEKID